MKPVCKNILSISVLLAVSLVSAAFADVVIYNTANYTEGKIDQVTDKSIVMKLEEGQHEIPRQQVAAWFQEEIGKKGSDYYNAGQYMLRRGRRDKATELFRKAVEANPAYRQPAENALNASSVSFGTRPSVAATVQPVIIAREGIVCPICSGEGKVSREYTIRSGTKMTRIEQCWFCDGIGGTVLNIPERTRKCSDCNGWGWVPQEASTTSGSSSSSSSSGFSRSKSGTGDDKKKMGSKAVGIDRRMPCQRCDTKGVVTLSAVQINYGVGGASVANTTGSFNPGGSANPNYSAPGGTGSVGYSPQQNNRRNPANTTRNTTTSSDADDEEDVGENESEAEDEGGFFSRHKTMILVVGGGALLLIVLILSQSSKK